MADLPVLEWKPGTSYGKRYAVAALGVASLYAYENSWQVDWRDDSAEGDADSLDDAKARARGFAKTLLQQVLAQLDRTIDPETGLVVRVAEASDAG